MKNTKWPPRRKTERLTVHLLKQLKKKGFNYMKVTSLSIDGVPTYNEVSHFVLIPFLELSDNDNDPGIYEPIESTILKQWANAPAQRTSVLVATV